MYFLLSVAGIGLIWQGAGGVYGQDPPAGNFLQSTSKNALNFNRTLRGGWHFAGKRKKGKIRGYLGCVKNGVKGRIFGKYRAGFSEIFLYI